MRRKINYIILFVILSVILINHSYKKVFAASATLELSTDNLTVEKGNNFTVIMTVSADVSFGDLEAYISYDETLFELLETAKNVNGGEGLIRITDVNEESSVSQKSYAMKFKALASGAGDFIITDKPVIYSLSDGTELSVSQNRLTINVEAAKEESKDNSLSQLKISPGTLTPKFSKDIMKYKTKVSNAVKMLTVSAVPSDDKANVEIMGNETLIVGKNEVKITVTAESGDKKIYTILAEKQKPSQTETKETAGNKKENTAKKTNNVQNNPIKAVKSGKALYLKQNLSYQIIDSDGAVPPEGYIKTTGLVNGIQIPVYENTKGKVGEPLLVFAKNGKTKAAFYLYDRKLQTIQLYDSSYKEQTSDKTQAESDFNKIMNHKEKLKLYGIISALSALSAILLIGIIRLYIKNKGLSDDELE